MFGARAVKSTFFVSVRPDISPPFPVLSQPSRPTQFSSFVWFETYIHIGAIEDLGLTSAACRLISNTHLATCRPSPSSRSSTLNPLSSDLPTVVQLLAGLHCSLTNSSPTLCPLTLVPRPRPRSNPAICRNWILAPPAPLPTHLIYIDIVSVAVASRINQPPNQSLNPLHQQNPIGRGTTSRAILAGIATATSSTHV